MKRKISIIIPIYKTEKYLRDCIDSVLAQTYGDFECILIDDGSPDNAPAICDEYAAKDSRIIVIHQKNQGISAARNAGLDAAVGEWIAFLDSDDFWHPQMLEIMLEAAEMYEADMVKCSHRTCNEKIVYKPIEKRESLEPKRTFIFDGCKDILKLHIKREPCRVFVVVWETLYKSIIFNKEGALLRFANIEAAEDIEIFSKTLWRAKKIVCIENRLYSYRLNKGSITGGGLGRRTVLRMSAIIAYREDINFLRAVGYTEEELRPYIVHVMKFLINTYYVLIENQAEPSQLKFCKEAFSEYYAVVKENRLPIKYAIPFSVFNKSSDLFWKMGGKYIFLLRKKYIESTMEKRRKGECM